MSVTGEERNENGERIRFVSKIDSRLKGIAPKLQFGCRMLSNKQSILSIGDNEYVCVVGSQIMTMDNNIAHGRKTRIIETHSANVIGVNFLAVSPDTKLLAACVKTSDESTATIMLFILDGERTARRKPRTIEYKNTSYIGGNEHFEFTSLTFSHDSIYFACSTNVPALGIIVYDQNRGTVFQKINSDNSPSMLSFNPTDSSKICGTGVGNLFKFWRVTHKQVNTAPVVGLRPGNYTYSCHAWSSALENLIVAGSSTGFLVCVQGCEQKSPGVQAFGSPSSNASINAIASILVRRDVVVAVSIDNRLAVYEIRKHTKSGNKDILASLQPMIKYKMSEIETIYGIQWTHRDSSTSFTGIAVAKGSIFEFELLKDQEGFHGGHVIQTDNSSRPATGATTPALANEVNGGGITGGKPSSPAHVSSSPSSSALRSESPTHGKPRSVSINATALTTTTGGGTRNINDYHELAGDRITPLLNFHSGLIHSLSGSMRLNSFVTASYEDSSVRLWDYTKLSNYTSNYMIESFRDKHDENPFHVEMHPSGLFVAVATESEVREFAITDGGLELIRRISVRAPFFGPNGMPFMVTAPVSLVRYSNGGNMIAVITGKLVQLFHLMVKDFGTSNLTGNTSRFFVLCDHMAAVTDLAYSRDDSCIITTASDGAVYSWKLYANSAENNASAADAAAALALAEGSTSDTLRGTPAAASAPGLLAGGVGGGGDDESKSSNGAMGNGLSRDAEYVFKNVPATKVAISKHKEFENHIVVCFETDTEVHDTLATEVVKKRRQSSIMVRKMSKAGSQMSGAINAALGVVVDSPGSVGSSPAGLSFADSPAAAGGGGVMDGAASSPQKNSAKKHVLAHWRGSIKTASPSLIYFDAPICSIALGDTDGPDKHDICVIGLRDGRIIVSCLPFPTHAIDLHVLVRPVSSSVTLTATATTTRHTGLYTGGGGGGRMTKLGTLAENEDGVVPGSETPPTGHAQRKTRRARGGGAFAHTKNSDGVLSAGHTGVSMMGFEEKSLHSALASVNAAFTGGGGDGVGQAVSRESGGGGGGGNSNGSLKLVTDFGSESGRGGDAPLISEIVQAIDIERCKVLRLHIGAVNRVCISVSGAWIFTGGTDGSVFVLATSRRAQEYTELPQQMDMLENKFQLIERSRLDNLRVRLSDVEQAFEQSKKDSELMIGTVLEGKDKIISDLQNRMKKELQKRDETIIQCRKEYIQLKSSKGSEVEELNKEYAKKINELELMYEKKFAEEALYLDKMKQAYDEYVLHSKMDLVEVEKKTLQKIKAVEQEKQKTIKDTEKQKQTLLQYFEYVKIRNGEILDSLEEKQVEERVNLAEVVKQAKTQLTSAQQKALTDSAHASRKIAQLTSDLEAKELSMLQLNTDVAWAHERIQNLETALKKATADLGRKEGASNKWELQCGELHQKIIDLERIRKALTSQLHALRQELGPKEEKLVKTSERLTEMEREYEMSLLAINDKEKALHQKGESLNLLQKQVRELRTSGGRKDGLLRRAATLFSEYKDAVQKAHFMSTKKMAPKQKPPMLHGTANSSTLGGTAGGAGDGMGATSASAAESVPPTPKVPSTASGGGDNSRSSKSKDGKNNGKDKDSELVEIIVENPGMKLAMRRLEDILLPFLTEDIANVEEVRDEMAAVRDEQERHLTALHRNVAGLRLNLDGMQAITANKIQHHLVDNQSLLHEVNNLRSEIKLLSLENQRLLAANQVAAIKASHAGLNSNRHDDSMVSHGREKFSDFDKRAGSTVEQTSLTATGDDSTFAGVGKKTGKDSSGSYHVIDYIKKEASSVADEGNTESRGSNSNRNKKVALKEGSLASSGLYRSSSAGAGVVGSESLASVGVDTSSSELKRAPSRASIAPVQLATTPVAGLSGLDVRIKNMSAGGAGVKSTPQLGDAAAGRPTMAVSASESHIVGGKDAGLNAEQKIAMLITLNEREIKAANDKEERDYKANMSNHKPAMRMKGKAAAPNQKGSSSSSSSQKLGFNKQGHKGALSQSQPIASPAFEEGYSVALNMNSMSTIDDEAALPPREGQQPSRQRIGLGSATIQLPKMRPSHLQ